MGGIGVTSKRISVARGGGRSGRLRALAGAAAGLVLAGCATTPLPTAAIVDPARPWPVEPSRAAAHPDEAASPSTPTPGPREDLVRYRGPVEHIFFHPLMVHPKVALSSSQGRGFNEYFVTVREFRRMLPQLYARDWVLVDIESLVTLRRTRKGPMLERADLWLPRGKKPLVISVDDLNFYEYMRASGLNHRLVLDGNGDVAARFETEAGQPVVSRDTEIVPILDRFVEQHPDFSFDGAKGVIALTGYEGILGYPTSGEPSAARARAREQVAPIVERLEATGWTFASHSFGHPDIGRSSDAAVAADTQRWETEVEPLVGPTQVFVYPFGSAAVPGTAKFETLRHAGFRIFCPIAPTARLEVHHRYAISDRVHVDGISLLTQPETLVRFFDPKTVVDRVRPPL